MSSPTPQTADLRGESLTVIVPCYQEAPNVEALVKKVHVALSEFAYPWELICVDDGSTDGTGQLLQRARSEYGDHVRVIRLRRNFGQTAALQAGIDAARGTLIATLDGDLQNDPAEIPRMVDEFRQRDLDLLQGWRRARKDPAVRMLFSRVANRIIARVTGVQLHDYGCSLKIYRAEILREIRLQGEMHRFVPVWVAGVTSPLRIGETVVSHAPRERGESKYGLSRTFRVLVDLLAVFFFLRFRARPGHFFGSIGLFLGMLGGGILVYLAVLKFGLGMDIGQRPLLLVGVILTVFAVQFLTTGVLSELLARVFFDSSLRTEYSIRQADKAGDPGWCRPGATKINAAESVHE